MSIGIGSSGSGRSVAVFAMLLFFWVSGIDGRSQSSERLQWVAASDAAGSAAVVRFAWSEGRLESSPEETDFSKILRVYAAQGGALSLVDLPPMLGKYSLEGATLTFRPQFPLVPDVTYRAIATGADGSVLTAEYRLTRDDSVPRTQVEAIYPTADQLPENLLKFYIVFSQPMRRGGAYSFLRLVDDESGEVPIPFLEIDEELWSRDMRRLTLLIDPGRIKRGVRPLEEIGPALLRGKSMRLEVSADWKDASGRPLIEESVKEFDVVAPERRAIEVENWKIQPPMGGTREPLIVQFDRPMDYALARRLIGVSDLEGRQIPCESSLEDNETRLLLSPVNDWEAGELILWAVTTLEDLAGNNIGKPFEVDVVETGGRRIEAETVRRRFEIPTP